MAVPRVPMSIDPVLIQIATEIAQTVRGQVHQELYELLITRIARALEAERDMRPIPRAPEPPPPPLDVRGLVDLDRRCGPFPHTPVFNVPPFR